MNDPFVDEIRQYRDAHAARFNYDLKAIYEDIKRREKEREEKTGCKFVSCPPRRMEPPATMMKPKVYADFHNADKQGRLRLNCVGTAEDLARQAITLHDGMALTFYSDDLDENGQLDELLADGVVSFSKEESCWVATIDWTAI